MAITVRSANLAALRTGEGRLGCAEYPNYDGLGLAELVKKKKIKPAALIDIAIEPPLHQAAWPPGLLFG